MHKQSITAALAITLALVSGAAAQEAQGTMPTPAFSEYPTGTFDRSDEIKVTGEVQKIEKSDAGAIVWLQAEKVEKKGFGERPGTDAKGKGDLWRVEGEFLAKLKDPSKLTLGAKIAVTGYNFGNKACNPTCRIEGRSLSFR
jgi:hypothetical protein